MSLGKVPGKIVEPQARELSTYGNHDNPVSCEILGLGRVRYFEALFTLICLARVSEFDIVWDTLFQYSSLFFHAIQFLKC